MPNRNVTHENPLGVEVDAMSSGVAMPPWVDIDPLVTAIQATGASMGEALGQVAASLGPAAVKDVFMRQLDPKNGYSIARSLQQVGAVCPEAANAWLDALLAEGVLKPWKAHDQIGTQFHNAEWLTSLMSDIQTKQNLMLNHNPNLTSLSGKIDVGGYVELGHTPIERLPDGMRVGKELDLTACVSLTHLPEDMKIGGWLMLTGCRAWDGIIPESADIGGHVYTPLHPEGMRLEEWRKRYPQGERPGDGSPG